MRKVLMISPHFPPDATAATHRVRLLAPHLPAYGWEPTVLTCDPAAYEGFIDPRLALLVPEGLRVVRVPALPPRLTRAVRVGDLGLRSLAGLRHAARELCRHEQFDAVFITIFPAYTALLGPMLVRRFKLPFILDYQDPWVSVWGREVGGGAGGTVDLKSRVSRWLAMTLEPRVLRAASAITGVSAGTFEPALARNPGCRPLTAVIPIGAEPRDFSTLEADAGSAFFDAADGNIHICHVGTILPLGQETLGAFLQAVSLVRHRRPDLYRRLRLHFFGTSNQSTSTDVRRVVPLAKDLGVADVVNEIPTRIPYSSAVGVQRRATILLALGSSEPHYTASKIFPLLLAKRPALAIYHERSTVVEILSSVARAPSIRLVTFSDGERAASHVSAIFDELVSLAAAPMWREADVNRAGLHAYSAERLAARLASVLDDVVTTRAAA